MKNINLQNQNVQWTSRIINAKKFRVMGNNHSFTIWVYKYLWKALSMMLDLECAQVLDCHPLPLGSVSIVLPNLFFKTPQRISGSSKFFFWGGVYTSREKAMAPHSSTLAWRIPWTEEPGRLQSMGSWRVGHDCTTSLALFTFMHWRRKWQPTPVFLPGESQGRGSLVGCRLWGCTESDTTEAT